MNYTTFIAQPDSAKQTLVEIDIGESSPFANHEPGIWATTYSINKLNTSFNFGSGCFGFGAFGTSGTATLGNGNTRDKIGSIWVDGEYCTKYYTLAGVRANGKSFYFDFANSQLFVALDNFDAPGVFDSVQIGVTNGYSNRSCYLDDIYYDGRVAAVPGISQRKDPLFFGLLHFEGGNIDLINTDGAFDNLATRNVFGQQCRILFGSPDFDYSNFAVVYSGIVEDFTFQGDRISIAVQDKRKGLSRTLPINYFSATTHPNIADNNIGKGIPIAYGTIRNAPVVCTNEKSTLAGSTGLYYFKLCDTSYHAISAVTTARVEGSSGTIAACTAGNINLNAATFTLNAEQYESGRDVTVDFSGYVDSGGIPIENGLDIITDLMANYAGVAYDTVNYDTTEWAAERTNIPNMCLFVDDERELIDAIGDICKSAPGIFLVRDDGRYTFKTYDAGKAPDRTILATELLTLPTVGYESQEYLTSILVHYNKDWDGDKWQSYIDDTRERMTFQQYKVRRQKTFDTLLTGLTAAAAFGAAIMNRSDTIEPTFTITTKTQNINLEIEDIVDAEVYIFDDGTYGTVRCELMGIDKDLMNYTVTLNLRRIEDVTPGLTAATFIRFYGDSFYGDSYYTAEG